MDSVTLCKLNEEIQSEFKKLSDLDIGKEQYQKTVDGLTKLVDRQIEMEKFIIENEQKVEAQKREEDLKREQMEDERKDRKVKNGLTLAGIVIPVGITVWGTLKSLKFEEKGVVTTLIGKGFINKLLPKK